eukprot:TRINITY_DN701_c0_g1_i1.p1 TRINITY_DN701_c0_g1~~TRINITY_DN701_c0_g1_i1.p1  ORF type:complete len:172 (-),score=37.82 TRINITY_DN701_c0_g1_i1:194-709(-)
MEKEEERQSESGGEKTDNDTLDLEVTRKMSELEEESKKLKLMQEQVESMTNAAVDKEEVDSRSCWIGNVDFGATPEELKEHFQACGSIVRVTILVDKFTGQPKGFAYLEFVDKESVTNALELNESMFRNRPLKVSTKRTNLPGAAFRGRYHRGRARRRFRSRRAFFHPYSQ